MTRLKPTLLSCCISASLFMAPLALAQTAEPGDVAQEASAEKAAPKTASQLDAVTLGGVEVTARGVSESLQSIPIPISAVSAQTIEEKGFEDVRDIAAFTPGFSFRSAFGRGFDRPVIRGMSNIQGEPNASFFIDGIFVDGDISAYGLENLERVEVIRGPQSAAFGRRTFSGAVNYITKRPGTRPGGKFSALAGNYGQYKYAGSYSNTTNEGALGFDVSFIHRGNDSIYYNPISGTDDLGGTESTGMMASAVWNATDNLELLGRVMYQQTDDEFYAISRLGANAANCYAPNYTGGRIPGAGFPITSTRRRGYFCGELKTPSEFPINTPVFEAAGYPAGNRGHKVRSSLVANYYFPNNWQLTSTSAYNKSTTWAGNDQDYSGIRGFGGAFETFFKGKTTDYSQDLRITTDLEKPVYATFGGYYYHQSPEPGYRGDLAGYGVGPGPPTGRPVAVMTNPQGSTVNKAVYGFVNWDINDQWTASLEARYAIDELTVAAVDQRSLVINGVPTLVSRPYALSNTLKSFTPRATLGYQWQDNIHVFGLVSKGTKPGGFNLDIQRADFTEASREELIARGFDTFDEETAWNYELGIKTGWDDNRLMVNASLFWIDWTNQQLTEGGPARLLNNTFFSTSYTSNIGESQIRGFELESQWAFAPGWLGTMSYSYTDAEITKFFSQGQADLICEKRFCLPTDPEGSSEGKMLPRVPKTKLAVGLLYEGQLANGWGWSANGDVNFESKRWDIANLAYAGDSTTANFRFSVAPSDSWRVSAFVRNAFNDDAAEDITRYLDPEAFIAIPAVPPATGVQVTQRTDFAVSAPRPRMYGVEVSYQF